MKSNRFWVAIICTVFFVAVAVWWLLQQPPASVANVYLNGVLIETIDLTVVGQTRSFTVNTAGRGFNVISVEHGRICVSDANCPDKSCVRLGWVSSSLMPLVCLPHGLVISLESGIPAEFDAVIG